MKEKPGSRKDVRCFAHGDRCREQPTDLSGVTTVTLHTHNVEEPYRYFCEAICPHCIKSYIGPQPHKKS